MRGPHIGNRSLIRAAVLVAATTTFGWCIAERAPAAEALALPGAGAPVIKVVASEAASQFVPLGIGKSVVIDFPHDIKDVLVADPKIANAVIRSTRRAYIIGAAVGQTSVFFFDSDGRQIGGFDVAVTRDLNGLRAAIKQALPGLDIHVEGLGEGLVLTGNVATPIEAQQAFDIASRLVDDGHKVVNGILVHGRDQVMLKVTVAEVQRDIIKQLGIDLNGTVGIGSAVLNLNNSPPFPVYGQPLFPSAFNGTFKSISATLQAMERPA